jgi:acetyl esterase/lipase
MPRSTIVGVVWLGFAVAALGDPRPLPHTHLGEPMPSPSSHVVYHGLEYAAGGDKRLDIYAADPVEAGSPVIVYLHDGEDLARKAELLTTGVGVVLVSLAKADAGFDVVAQDTAEALVWVEENIADFGGRPERIVLMGHGADASLASLVATDARYLDRAGRDSSLLAGVVAIDGDTYLLDDAGYSEEELTTRYGEAWRDAAPAAHLVPGSTLAPHLLLHITAAVDPSSQSEIQSNLMAAALRSVGVRADVAALDHVDHAGANERLGEPGDAITAALERFLGRLRGANDGPSAR